MVQAAGQVNLKVKNKVGFYDSAGVAQIGDGVTSFNVTPKTACDLADAGALAAGDILVEPLTDFPKLVRSLDNSARA
jgi:hypothetical protein